MGNISVAKHGLVLCLLFGCSLLASEAGYLPREAGDLLAKYPSLAELSRRLLEAQDGWKTGSGMAYDDDDDAVCHSKDFEKFEEMLRYVSDDRNTLKRTVERTSCGERNQEDFSEFLRQKDGRPLDLDSLLLRYIERAMPTPFGPFENFTTAAGTAEREECYIDYAGFVEPITNSILNGVFDAICSNLDLASRICNVTNFLPPPLADRCEDILSGLGTDICTLLRLPDLSMPDWGGRMIDAMSKIPTSISDGRLAWVGAYDLCQNYEVSYDYRNESARNFTGKYCRLDLTIHENGSAVPPVVLQFGVCVPDTCNSAEVNWYISQNNTVLAVILQVTNMDLTYVYCGMEELDGSTDAALIVALTITFLFALVVLLATLYDGCCRRSLMKRHVRDLDDYINASVVGNKMDREELLDEKPLKIRLSNRAEMLFVGFSGFTNFRKVFTTRDKPGDVPALNGIRALSYFYVMWGNTFVFGPIYFEAWVTANILGAVPRLTQNLLFQPIVNFHLAEDSFLAISGILVTYWWLRRYEEAGGKLSLRSIVYYFVHRYWRLMPVMMLSIMIFTCTYKYTADGPLFPPKDTDGENCRVNWWVDLLMLHNIVKVSAQCFGHAWFVPLVFQLHVAAIVVVIPLVLFPVIGYVMIGVLYVVHIAATAAISSDLRDNRMEDWYNEYLLTPWCRAGPFVIGLAFGVLLHKRREKGLAIHWAVNLLLWLGAFICVLLPAFASYGQYKEDGERWSTSALVAYDTLARSSWGLGVAWMAIASHFKRGGVIESFLCWKAWTPISRLVYTTLLMHGLFIFQWVYTNRQPIYIDNFHMMYAFFGHIIYIMLIGLLVSLVWDLPLGTGVEKALTASTKFHWIRAGRHPRSDLRDSERRFWGLDEGGPSTDDGPHRETGFALSIPNCNYVEANADDIAKFGFNVRGDDDRDGRADKATPGHSNHAFEKGADDPDNHYERVDDPGKHYERVDDPGKDRERDDDEYNSVQL